MLPITHAWKEGSMSDLIKTTPQMDLATQDIEHLVEELRAYHAIYSPLFQRREAGGAGHTYLPGWVGGGSREPCGDAGLGGGVGRPPAGRARPGVFRAWRAGD